ncbi:MAG: SDR family NAD(P)-dependent oxidoreductase [Sciscionella sp.]
MAPESPDDIPAGVVLGAAGGIGRACVQSLLARGHPVVAVDHDPAVAGLAEVIPVTGDVTDPALLDTAFAACPTPPGVLVHAILADARAPLAELSAADWHRVLDAGLVSAWQAAVRLRAGGRVPASVVLIGSVHAHGAVPGQAAYAATKAALPALARAIATEWGPEGIRCNVVEPGFVAIPRNQARWRDGTDTQHLLAAYPLQRLCRPEEIATVVRFLASDDASYVNGTCLTVDGGALAVLPEVNRL